MSRPTIGVGMLGYGFIGKVHTECYRSMPMYYDAPPADIRLVGVATAHAETAEHAVRQAGYGFGTTDWRRVVEHPDVQVVNICSPNGAHREQVLAALAAGKHVYCDKPLATTPAEAEEMARAAHRAHVVHRMTQNYRYIPATMRAKELADAGFLGRPYSFRAAYLHGGAADPKTPARWKMQGGGSLHDLGAHIIDMMRHLWGEFAEVTARRAVLVPERPASKGSTEKVRITGDDASWMIARLANGALGTIETSKVATGAEDELRFELHGDAGAMKFNLMDPSWLYAYDARTSDAPHGGERGFLRIAACSRDGLAQVSPARSTPGWIQFHLRCLHAFVSDVARAASGGAFSGRPDFFDGWAAHEVFAAAEASNASGRWEQVRQVERPG